MRFLDGLKTALGTLALLAVTLSSNDLLPLLPASWRPYVTGAALLLTALGVVHKVEKARAGDVPRAPDATDRDPPSPDDAVG